MFFASLYCNLRIITRIRQCLLQTFSIGFQTETSANHAISFQTVSGNHCHILTLHTNRIHVCISGRGGCCRGSNRRHFHLSGRLCLSRSCSVATTCCCFAFSYAFLYALSEDLQEVIAKTALNPSPITKNFFILLLLIF